MFLDAFRNIVVALVGAVQVERRKIPARADLSCLQEKPPHQFILDKWIRIVVVAGAENELIVGRDAIWKERKLKLARTVVAAEIKPIRKLAGRRITRPHVIAALHADAAIGLELRVVRRIKKFN